MRSNKIPLHVIAYKGSALTLFSCVQSSSVSSSPAANEDKKRSTNGLSRVSKGLTDFLFEPDAPLFPTTTTPTQHKKA